MAGAGFNSFKNEKGRLTPGAEFVESFKNRTVSGAHIVVGQALVEALDVGGVHPLQEFYVLLGMKSRQIQKYHS
jgi:hypothetical protein